jgi:hypothetical protein
MMTRLMTRRAPVAAVGVAALIGALAVGVTPANAAPGEQVFTYTGAEQTFTVPAGVSSITVTAIGGRGGGSTEKPAFGGLGGSVESAFPVTPGVTLYVEVGGDGQQNAADIGGGGGFNGGGQGGAGTFGEDGGGGAGGASDVRTIARDDANSADSLASRLIVAAGGGGAGGGDFGSSGGGAGSPGVGNLGRGGGAGTLTSGGAGGGTSPTSPLRGDPGVLGAGGAGGTLVPGAAGWGGGGGGAGVYGGGGGAASGLAGGGGGGANSDGSTNTSTAPASVTISWVSVAAPTFSGTPGEAVVGSGYSFPYTVTGDPAPVVSVSAGTLPPGLSLSSEGVLSGTPTQAGPFSFTLKADNGVGTAATLESSLTVVPANAAPGAVTIDSVTAGAGQITVAFTPGDPGYPTDVLYTAIANNAAGTVFESVPVTSSPAVITGLPNGAYQVSVIASNSTGAAGTDWPGWVQVGPVYTFSGFFSPVDNAPVVNTAKAGSALPIKFSLGGDYGLNIFTSAGPTFTTGSCTGGTEDPVTVVAASNSGLTYDATSGVYTYTWKAAKDLAGKCGSFSLNLNDGSTHTVLVKFK